MANYLKPSKMFCTVNNIIQYFTILNKTNRCLHDLVHLSFTNLTLFKPMKIDINKFILLCTQKCDIESYCYPSYI